MTGRILPRFRYSLAPVLRREAWESHVLALEAARAQRILEDRRRQHEGALRQVGQGEAAMRAMHQPSRPIPLERRELLQAWLSAAHATAEARAREMDEAAVLCRRIEAQLAQRRRAVKAMERQRERQRRTHAIEDDRMGMKLADELWLTRRR